MSIPSFGSGDNLALTARLRTLYQVQKPDIKIDLSRDARSFTTGDQIDGTVSITAAVDTPFDSIDIEFIGSSRTYVEHISSAAAMSGRTEAHQQFLKLQQPRLHLLYPSDRILCAGQTYCFPFVFVIPQQLLPRICQHKVLTPAVQDAHLQLPPTCGDRGDRDSPGASPADDMVPDMASIRYGIHARISRTKRDSTSGDAVRPTLASRVRRVRVLPAAPERPPLDVTPGEDGDYVLRKERTIRKGMLQGKLGTLVVEAAQPAAISIHGADASPHTGMVTIMLRFDGTSDSAPPPRLGSLVSKMKVNTFFATSARHVFPTKHSATHDMAQGLHCEQLQLSSRCMANVEWTCHDSDDPCLATPAAGPNSASERRDSAFSLSAPTPIPAASTSYRGGKFHVARILVPLSLPRQKSFLPTFHTCLISRTYLLKLEVGLQTASLGGSSVDVRLPLQLMHDCAGSADRRSSAVDVADGQMGTAPPPLLESEGRATAAVDPPTFDEIDFFAPRTIHAPASEYVGRSRIGSVRPGAEQMPAPDDAPPGYSLLVPVH